MQSPAPAVPEPTDLVSSDSARSGSVSSPALACCAWRRPHARHHWWANTALWARHDWAPMRALS